MNLNRLLVPAIALFLGTTGLYTAKASGQYQGNPPSSYDRDRGAWDAPPQGMQEIQRQGFRDGLIGAQKDYDNHRQWDVNNRDEYRNPNIPRNQRAAYQDGFRRGYDRGVSHLTGGSNSGGFYSGQGQGQGSDIQRRGYQDGMVGAQKDLDNHRQWKVNNRDEYRNPNVPAGAQQEYRDAFSSGYQQFVSQQNGGSYMGQGQGSDIQRRGYQDGMVGAQKDLDNHRQWNVNNRDEYRNPNVPAGAQQEYRDAFSSGYQQFVSQQNGGSYMGQGQGSDIQRRGYQDGMVGAQKDLDNHRQWNVNNRDEYRNPNVPAGAQQEYRDAYRRGYQQFVSQHSGGQPYRP